MGKWLITRNPLKTFGLNDLGENFKSREIVPALVRESIQNGLDAKAQDSDHVTMKFGYFRIDPNEIPGALEMKKVFSFCRDFPGRSNSEQKFFQHGLQVLGDAVNKMGMLRISDYGTCGLRGAKTNANGSRWKGLVMTSGAGNDDGSRGGGFGLGKEAMYLASSLRTIFFSTIEDEDNYAAHMGVGCLATFNYKAFGGNQQADRNIFYCADDYDPEKGGSVPSIPGVIKFSDRKPGEYGTDVFIPGFEIESDKEKLSAVIMGEVLKSFMVAIDQGALEVELPNGMSVRKDNLGERVDWYKHFATKDEKELVSDLYKLTKVAWKHSGTIVLGIGVDNFPEGAFDYKFIQSDNNINNCFITREKGMVVHTVKNVCGSASAVGFIVVRNANLNSVFKKMENARHDKFEVSNGRFPDKNERSVAKAQFAKLQECAVQWAEEDAGVEIVDSTAAVLPDELDELMEVCAGQFTVDSIKSKSGKRPGIGGVRVKRHKHRHLKASKSVPANLTDEENENQPKPGVPTGKGTNKQKRGNPVSGKKYVNPNAPESNGFMLSPLENPIFYATGRPETGRYRFSFRVPHAKPKVCICFSSTTENDGREALSVKSATASSGGICINAWPDLENTVVSFENVAEGQIIDAEIEFDVSHYCYAEVRYYEKKNV